MDSFVPPGYTTPGELVELTGMALHKDAWVHTMRAAAHARVIVESWQRRVSLDRSIAAASPRPGGGARYLPASPEAAANLAARAKAALPAMHSADTMRGEVSTALRTALYSNTIAAVIINTSDGCLVEIPTHFWLGDGAVQALDTGAATIYFQTGRVLFKRAEAEAWLAGYDTPASESTAEERARGWFRTKSRGEKRCTRDEYCAQMVRQFKLSSRCARKIWDQEAPESWKRKGVKLRPQSTQ